MLPLPPATRIDGGRRYEARNEAHTLVVTILDRVCADAMTGMPRPAAVEVSLDGQVLKGCGGDATALLRSGPWMVETVRDRPLALLPTQEEQAGGAVEHLVGLRRHRPRLGHDVLQYLRGDLRACRARA